MERSLSFLGAEGWLSEDGWPYGDVDADADEVDPADPAADLDEDLVALHATAGHLFDGLAPLERAVLSARFGFDGPPRTLRELQHDLGVPRSELRLAYGDALAKIRGRLV